MWDRQTAVEGASSFYTPKTNQGFDARWQSKLSKIVCKKAENRSYLQNEKSIIYCNVASGGSIKGKTGKIKEVGGLNSHNLRVEEQLMLVNHLGKISCAEDSKDYFYT